MVKEEVTMRARGRNDMKGNRGGGGGQRGRGGGRGLYPKLLDFSIFVISDKGL